MKKTATRKEKLAALKAESDRALVDMIRRLFAKPPQERTHFFAKKSAFAPALSSSSRSAARLPLI
jgi:hypothetical protein